MAVIKIYHVKFDVFVVLFYFITATFSVNFLFDVKLYVTAPSNNYYILNSCILANVIRQPQIASIIVA